MGLNKEDPFLALLLMLSCEGQPGSRLVSVPWVTPHLSFVLCSSVSAANPEVFSKDLQATVYITSTNRHHYPDFTKQPTEAPVGPNHIV